MLDASLRTETFIHIKSFNSIWIEGDFCEVVEREPNNYKHNLYFFINVNTIWHACWSIPSAISYSSVEGDPTQVYPRSLKTQLNW